MTGAGRGFEIEMLGRRALAVRADVARADQVDAMVERVLARFGRLDILVNDAGVMTRGQFLDVPIFTEALVGRLPAA